MLSPLQNFHKFLLSSPTRFRGQYEQPDLLIAPAYPSVTDNILRDTQSNESPFNRHYYVFILNFTFDSNDILIPDLSYIGDYFAIALSLYYGKSFHNHGVIESHGIFSMPVTNNIAPLRKYKLPINNQQPRKDLEIALDLCNCSSIINFLLKKPFDSLSSAFLTAGKFYLRSLQSVDTDIEGAFLDLVTCGEILANRHEYAEDELYDENTQKIFEELKSKGVTEESVKVIKQRFFQVKRKFVMTLKSFLNKKFFTKTESKEEWGRLKEEKIEGIIKSVYDLRSQYVHNGITFKTWIEPEEYYMNEITGLSSGVKANIDNTEVLNKKERKNIQKILEKAPTYLGLERIMRFSLLSLLHNNGVYIHQDLEPDNLLYCWLPNATKNIMAKLPEETLTIIFTLQRQLLQRIDEATATGFTIFQEFGETEITVSEL